MNNKRRDVLKAIGCVSALALIDRFKTNANSKNNNLDVINEYDKEFLLTCREQWLSCETLLPIDYISNTKSENQDKDHHEIITQEFKNFRTINIEGLILSKYEAAHLAELILYSV
jgi:hypothetical protein